MIDEIIPVGFHFLVRFGIFSSECWDVQAAMTFASTS